LQILFYLFSLSNVVMTLIKADLTVFGAGIAGLWIVNVAKNLGLSVLLVEPHVVGGTQTLASQGMIHGGQRYGLQGKENDHIMMLKDLPEIWNECLAGSGPLDLSDVDLLAENQFMWSPGKLFDTVANFFASKVMQSEIEKVERKNWPAILDSNCGRLGSVYRLKEVVVDTLSLVEALFKPLKDSSLKGEVKNFTYDDNKINQVLLSVGEQQVTLESSFYVFTAGTGNEELRDKLNLTEKVKTQRRPLKQILVSPAPFDLFAHCITTDPRPRATITTHYKSDGTRVWYMGGLVGVYGVDKSDEEALKFAKKEITSLFPNVDWSKAEWAVLPVDRAEPKVESGFLPDGPQSAEVLGNGLFLWPTKMTFAPAVGAEAEKWLKSKEITLKNGNEAKILENYPDLPRAVLGENPWDSVNWINDDLLIAAEG
jgi:glycerol-3-phosphate dehydrogenase